MIGFVDYISNPNAKFASFSNINYIDSEPSFYQSRKSIKYIVPEFLKYISGDRRKSKLYGNIKKFYPEELIFMDKNISKRNSICEEQSVDNIKNADIIIEDSCAIYADLRVVIVNDNFDLSSIAKYDIISFTKNDRHINTVFIQNNVATIPFVFVICLKLFDRIILNHLSDLNIPIYNNIIPILKSATDTMYTAKFIIDYLYELIYPFVDSLSLEKDEIDSLLKNIYTFNSNIISLDTIKDLYILVRDTERGLADNYDYINFISKVDDEIKGINFDPDKE